MKKLILFSLLITILFTFCKKRNDIVKPYKAPPDYRDVFVGEYEVFRTNIVWSITNPLAYTTDYENLIIYIEKLKGDKKSLLIENDTIPIDSSGSYVSSLNELPGYQYYSIKLRNDSLILNTVVGNFSNVTNSNSIGYKSTLSEDQSNTP